MGRKGRANGGVANAASCLDLGPSSPTSMGPGSVSTASVCSAFSYLDGETEDIQVDEFEKKLDSLFEKRGSTREKALASLAVMLRVDYRDQDCTTHNETITSRCLIALKRGSPMESSLASQLLGLHVLTLGQQDEGLFNSLRLELERTASGAKGGGPAVQCAAAESLALAAFVLAEDEDGTRAVMDRLRALWCKGDPKVRAAAVRGWSFLLTCLDGRLRADEAAACLSGLAGLMQERDVELRTAAGEAVAVLRGACSHEVLELLEGEDGAEDEEEEEEEEGGEGEEREAAQQRATVPMAGHEKEEEEEEGAGLKDGVQTQGEEKGGGGGGAGRQRRGRGHRGRAANGGHRAGGHGGGGGGGGIDGVMGRMQDLADNKGDSLRRSRRERASQRSVFRGLLAALSGEEVPECRIKLQHGDSLTVTGVAATHQLAFLRRFLAGGFQAHLQHNPLLHDVFGFRPRTERAERLSAVEKRLTRSCQSADARARTANRQWSRDAKASRLGMGY